jgi:hypothetical protein
MNENRTREELEAEIARLQQLLDETIVRYGERIATLVIEFDSLRKERDKLQLELQWLRIRAAADTEEIARLKQQLAQKAP